MRVNNKITRNAKQLADFARRMEAEMLYRGDLQERVESMVEQRMSGYSPSQPDYFTRWLELYRQIASELLNAESGGGDGDID